MRIAGHMDNTYTNSTFAFRGGPVHGETAMETGVIPQKYKYVTLSKEEKAQLMETENWLSCQDACPKNAKTSIADDLILGKRWLTKINPIIDWARNRMRIKSTMRL